MKVSDKETAKNVSKYTKHTCKNKAKSQIIK